MEMHNLSPLLSSAFTVSRVREMFMRQEQFVILSTAPKPPKILVNYIHKNYRPQPCLPCDYFKLNISSLWSRKKFFEVFTKFLTTDFIYSSTDLKLIIPQPGSFLETPTCLLDGFTFDSITVIVQLLQCSELLKNTKSIAEVSIYRWVSSRVVILHHLQKSPCEWMVLDNICPPQSHLCRWGAGEVSIGHDSGYFNPSRGGQAGREMEL